MKRFKYGSDMVKLRSCCDSTSRVSKKLKTMCLSGWEIEWKRVSVVKFGMNKRDGYGTRCGTINGVAHTSAVSKSCLYFTFETSDVSATPLIVPQRVS